MTTEEMLQRVNATIARFGGVPKEIRLSRYASFSDWNLPAEDGPCTEGDFKTAQDNTDALATEFTKRGVKVIGVQFDRPAYDRWRGDRADSRNLRAEFINVPRTGQIELTFTVSYNGIGWAVIES